MPSAHTYSFTDVQCTLAGPGGVAVMGGGSGAAKEGITVSPSEDIATMQIGAGGEIMHSLHAARPARATIRLLKTSPVNAVLSAMFSVQAASASLWGKNTLVVSDIARGDIVTGSSAAFTKFADLTYAEDGNMNEWAFNIGYISFFLGTGS